MMALTANELDQVKRLLKNRRTLFSALVEDLTNEAFHELSSDETGEISRTRLHAADMASNESEKDVALKVASKEILRIKEIESALLKIKTGGYGLCDDCGLEIEKERLIAVPETPRCLECQGLTEKESKARQRPHEPDEKLRII